MKKTHDECLKLLTEAQETEEDNREAVREADNFINKRDGQWQPDIIKKFDGKPRFTFDQCGPIIDEIMGEVESMDFGINVSPSGNASDKKTAEIMAGLIRTIENNSKAKQIYNAASRIMIGTGFSAWRIINDYNDDETFYQDLKIELINNAQDNLFFDPDAVMPDMSDAGYCWILKPLTRRKYEEYYPNGKGLSVGSQLKSQSYYHKKPDIITVGEYYYHKKQKREIGLFSNGLTLELNEEYQTIKDELNQRGITLVKVRTSHKKIFYHRLFDGADWLNEEKETVFSQIPVVPLFGNFKVSEDKIIYYGVIEKLIDAQRVLNYAESRKIEEGALSPRGKYFMTKDQARSKDVQRTLRTLNTNSDPVQFYDHKEGQPPPSFHGSPTSNPGLVETSQSALMYIQRISGSFDEARGTAPAQRSGYAIKRLQDKSDNPKRKWLSAIETAITHTCRIIINAIPRVYDSTRQVRVLEQDGTGEEIQLYETVIDEQTGHPVTLNDLSKGIYDVVCSAGPAFTSRQQETVQTINELAAIDPSIMQIGSDILLNNINAPGIDKIAERKRAMMVLQGMIPPSQQTEEEKQIIAQQQGQQQPDSMAVVAQAEMKKAEVQAMEVQLKTQLEQQKLSIKEMELTLKAQIEQAKVEQSQQKQINDSIRAVTEQIKLQAEALETIKKAMGADKIMDPLTVAAYHKQSEEMLDTIENQ